MMDVFTGSNPHLNQNDISHPFKRVMTELITVRLTYYSTLWIMETRLHLNGFFILRPLKGMISDLFRVGLTYYCTV